MQKKLETEEERKKNEAEIESEIEKLLKVHEIPFFIKTYFQKMHDGN